MSQARAAAGPAARAAARPAAGPAARGAVAPAGAAGGAAVRHQRRPLPRSSFFCSLHTNFFKKILAEFFYLDVHFFVASI